MEKVNKEANVYSFKNSIEEPVYSREINIRKHLDPHVVYSKDIKQIKLPITNDPDYFTIKRNSGTYSLDE